MIINRTPPQDCCPRNPFWGYDSGAFAGELDQNLTRAVCIQESITLRHDSSICMKQFDLRTPGSIGQVNSKVLTTAVVIGILIAMCLVVVLAMVPAVVYSQLVYSGLWPVLTWGERFWCMLTGDFETRTEVEHKKNREHREAIDELARAQSRCCFHCAYIKISARKMRQTIERHLKGRPNSQDASADNTLVDRFLTCIDCLLLMVAVPLIRVATFDIIFDVFPLHFHTRCSRKLVKSLRYLIGSCVLGFLLIHVPHFNTSSLHDVVDCALASCQKSHWRKGAKRSELECNAARSVGLIQPSFWSDMVDIVQAALSLAVLTLLGEWREAVEGKNQVGATLLKEVDRKCGQRVDPQTELPMGRPQNTYTHKWSLCCHAQEAEAQYSGSEQAPDLTGLKSRDGTLGLLDDLKQQHKEPEYDPVAEVNVMSAGAKLTMAQLFSAVGSIFAIIVGAREYSSQCVLNVFLWNNYSSAQQSGRSFLDGSDDDFEVILHKPEREPLVTWSNMFRATMGNLMLVTIGVVLKNFITRTATAKMSVDAMLDKDKEHEDLHVLTLLFHSFVSGYSAMMNRLRRAWRLLGRMCNCQGSLNQATSDSIVVDDHETKLQNANLDDAVKQNARSIYRVYQISSGFIFIILSWYAVVFVFSCFYAPYQLLQVFTVNCITISTLTPLLQFIARPLKKGIDKDDAKKIDACIYVVQLIVVLRSTLTMAHTLMLRNISMGGYGEAHRITWESYWSNGDATEKLMNMLTFDLANTFDFEFNLTNKLLSFVVLGLEIVHLIGSNLKQTSIVRLCPRGCCQRSVYILAKRASSIGLLAEKVKSADAAVESSQELEDIIMQAAQDPEVLLEAGVEMGVVWGKDATKKRLQPYLSESGLAALDVVLRHVRSQDIQAFLTNPQSVLGNLVEAVSDAELLAVARAWLASQVVAKVKSHLQAKEQGLSVPARAAIMQMIESLELQQVWDEANELAANPVEYIKKLLRLNADDAAMTPRTHASSALQRARRHQDLVRSRAAVLTGASGGVGARE